MDWQEGGCRGVSGCFLQVCVNELGLMEIDWTVKAEIHRLVNEALQKAVLKCL